MMNDLQFFSHPKQLKKLKLDITSRLERDDETIAPHTNVSLRFVLMSLRNGYVPTNDGIWEDVCIPFRMAVILGYLFVKFGEGGAGGGN